MSMARANLNAWRGDSLASRAWADSAQRDIAVQLRDAPDDAQRYLIRGLALARLGRATDARSATERGLTMSRARPDAYFQPFYEYMAVRTYLILGEQDRALDLLEPIMQKPYFVTPAWLRLDPDLAPLAGNPRFERLASGRG